MRPYGHARIDATSPRARAVCDRCGFQYNHEDLQWQFDWRGPKVQNLRILVCDECLDDMQMNGQRTILIPADPIPIQNARPEVNVDNNNPLSTIGANASPLISAGANIGNMSGGGGLNAAFDSNTNKSVEVCATISVSGSSYTNYVGKNWSGNVAGITTPSSLMAPVLTYAVASFTMYAPNDAPFSQAGSVSFAIQGSPVDAGWGSWTTIYSGATAGIPGEIVSGATTGGQFQFHRVAFQGDGISRIALAQLQLNVSNYPSGA
jgi:hypothetical protein